MAIPVILDTDIGVDIDDTWALAYLLRCPELDLRLITTALGDPAYRARVAANLLRTASRTDIPIALGQSGPKPPRNQPSAAECDLKAAGIQVLPDAVSAIEEVVAATAAPITIISIAACDNIRRFHERNPEAAQSIRFVGMQGSIRTGYGDDSPPEPETNVREDPAAFRTVLGAPWKELLLTPLDTCGRFVIDGDDFGAVQRSADPTVVSLIQQHFEWCGLVPWQECPWAKERSSVLFDVVAVELAFETGWFEMEDVSLRVDDKGMTFENPDGHRATAAIAWRDRAGLVRRVVERLTAQA